MLSVLTFARKALGVRKALGWLAAGLAVTGLAACEPMTTGPQIGGGGDTVQVALLVPSGSGQASDEYLARSLENAARLAMADLGGVQIDLRVYQTAGQPSQPHRRRCRRCQRWARRSSLARSLRRKPMRRAWPWRRSGVNVLSFSNNPTIAGGNVFVLGTTFDNVPPTVWRAMPCGRARAGSWSCTTARPGGTVGRAAIESSVAAAGGSVVNVTGYEFSQNGLVAGGSGIAASARARRGGSGLFLTADTAGALPLLTQLLRDNGLTPETTQFIGLTRWDIPAATIALPGVQGGWFALPDPRFTSSSPSAIPAAYGSEPHPVSGLAYDGIAAIGALAGRAVPMR
jgi:hypothetical protein